MFWQTEFVIEQKRENHEKRGCYRKRDKKHQMHKEKIFSHNVTDLRKAKFHQFLHRLYL